jgi:hypothetical protein
VYLNVNFNVFFKLIKVHLLASELYKLYLPKFNSIQLVVVSVIKQSQPKEVRPKMRGRTLSCVYWQGTLKQTGVQQGFRVRGFGGGNMKGRDHMT